MTLLMIAIGILEITAIVGIAIVLRWLQEVREDRQAEIIRARGLGVAGIPFLRIREVGQTDSGYCTCPNCTAERERNDLMRMN